MFDQLLNGGALVLEGVAGIGKTYAIDEIRKALGLGSDACKTALEESLDLIIKGNLDTPEEGNLSDALTGECGSKCAEACCPRVTVLVMHPSTSYEEMIGGLRPVPDGRGVTFQWQPGKLLQAVIEAINCQESGGKCKHLIVLDEINRCNLPSVLGEFIYLIEPSKRVTADNWNGKYKKKRTCVLHDFKAVRIGTKSDVYDNDIIYIPENLHFLGTMNSSDRSILGFDQALRRRFPPYRMEPLSVAVLNKKLRDNGGDKAMLRLAIALGSLNRLLLACVGPDAMIGHSYLLNYLDAEHAWRFGILPQAIHSAESARKEELLHDIFSDIPESAFLQKHPASNFLKKKLTKDLARIRGFANDKKISVTLVGQGHGQKLLITVPENGGFDNVAAKKLKGS